MDFLFESAQQACRDIEILLNDEKIYGKMRSGALLNFKNKFDIGIAVRKVEKIYEQIFENK